MPVFSKAKDMKAVAVEQSFHRNAAPAAIRRTVPMKPLSPITRLIAASAAAGCTSVLFAAIVSFAEPQRSLLIAKNAEHRQMPPTRAASLKVAAR